MDNDFEQARTRLATKVARWTLGAERFVAPIDGLSLYRHAQAGAPASCMLAPAIAIPVQGAKQALIGTDSYVYGDGRFLITSVDLPAVLQVARASTLPAVAALARRCVLFGGSILSPCAGDIFPFGFRQQPVSLAGPAVEPGDVFLGDAVP